MGVKQEFMKAFGGKRDRGFKIQSPMTDALGLTKKRKKKKKLVI